MSLVTEPNPAPSPFAASLLFGYVGAFMYEGDRPKRWSAENDVWVHGYWFWDWADERQEVESIDTEQHIIAVVPPYHGYGYRVGQWFQPTQGARPARA